MLCSPAIIIFWRLPEFVLHFTNQGPEAEEQTDAGHGPDDGNNGNFASSFHAEILPQRNLDVFD